MSATVVPFRPRRAPPKGNLAHGSPPEVRSARPQRPAPIRIDGSVSLYQLLTGLQSVGLSLRRDPGSGVYIIAPQRSSQSPL